MSGFIFGNAKLTAEQRLRKATMDIISHTRYRALAGVMMIGKKEISDDPQECPTAYTDGRNEMYSRMFIDSIKDAELRFVVLHECRHKMYKHLITWAHLWEIDAKTVNQAADHVINLEIVGENSDGFAVPPTQINGAPFQICCDPKYRGMNTAQVFEDLRKNGTGGGSTLDAHDWENAKGMGPKEAKELAQDIDTALRQGAMAADKTGSGGLRAVDALLQVHADWREVLREFLAVQCAGHDYSTWAKPNRRYISSGVYMPSGVSETLGGLVFAIDTSGSIDGEDLTKFLSAVVDACNTVHPAWVCLMYWDTTVRGVEWYGQGHEKGVDQIAQSTKPAGGGGTGIDCVPAYMKEHNINPEAVIVLTDGYLWGVWGQWEHPLLWCVVGSKDVPPFGQYVDVNFGG